MNNGVAACVATHRIHGNSSWGIGRLIEKHVNDDIRVLHVVPSFFPATKFGGPVVSVFELCNHLAKNAGVTLRVLTTDTAGYRSYERLSVPERDPHRYQGYAVHFSTKVLGTAIAPQIWKQIWPAVSWTDVIHLTGMYSFPTLPTLLAARMLNKPLVWSPRGALKEWIGTKNKPMKATWRKMCRAILVPEKTVLHVTSSEEESETRLRMPGVSCLRIPNGVEIPKLAEAKEWMPNGELRLLSLGRLDPIKGLENLIVALRHLRAPRFSLRIFGTGDPGYQASLENLAAEHGVREKISFLGAASEEVKRSAFLSSDICVVPSFSENFGMVIAESLAHGTPVVASTGTPWHIVQTANIGRWVSNDPVALANAIDSLRSEDLASMGERAKEVMKSEYAWPAVAARMLAAYKALQGDTRKQI